MNKVRISFRLIKRNDTNCLICIRRQMLWQNNGSSADGFTRTFAATLSPTTSTAINARQVAIVADTINVNGDMIVGATLTPDQSLVVPAVLQAELRQPPFTAFQLKNLRPQLVTIRCWA